jgi:hypothetical protein
MLVSEQRGIRRGISTEVAAFSLKEGVFKHINRENNVAEILCDLA